MPQFDLFLSHYSGDRALADSLREALTASGLNVWYDDAEIRLGDSIISKMQEGVQRSRYGLILFTPGFLGSSSGFRWAEVEAYLADQLATGQTRLLPLVAGVDHDEYKAKLPLLRARRYERVTLDGAGHIPRDELARVVRVITEVTTLRTVARMVGRDDVDREIGSLEDRLRDVRELLLVSGNDCKAVVESKSAFLRRALERGVKVRIMCVDPDSAGAVAHLVKIDPRFTDAADFSVSMRAVEHGLMRLRADYPTLFEFRYMPVAPSIGLFISDPNLRTQFLKVEIYTPKPWAPIVTRPHVIINPGSIWREYFMVAWDNYWNMSRVP